MILRVYKKKPLLTVVISNLSTSLKYVGMRVRAVYHTHWYAKSAVAMANTAGEVNMEPQGTGVFCKRKRNIIHDKPVSFL